MKIVIAATPAAGYLNPFAAIGRILIDNGHDVTGPSGSAFRQRFERIGAEFRLLPAGADPDFQDIVLFVPELADCPKVRARMADAFAAIDTGAEILQTVNRVTGLAT